MLVIRCSVCEVENELPDDTKVDDRFTCTNCFAQLSLKIVNGEKVARCAVCLLGKEKETFECSDDCERKVAYQEKRGFPFPE